MRASAKSALTVPTSPAKPHRLGTSLGGFPLNEFVMSDSVGQYLNEIGAVALLNAQEERELSQIIEKGFEARARKEAGEKGRDLDRAIRNAEAAKDRFIRANLRLVVSVARRYPLPPGMELLDLIQEGNLGLEHAVDKFDWRKGFKFSTYACRAILKAFSRQGMKQTKYRQRFPTEFDPLLEKSNESAERRREDELERAAEAVHVIVENTADLTDIEQEVIHHRFGCSFKLVFATTLG